MNRTGLWGISPIIVFLIFYLGSSLLCGDFSKVPLTTAFFVTSVYSIAITKALPMNERVKTYGRGAGDAKVMFMIWIFLAAGAFATCAQAMGCVQATVNLILKILPGRFIYIGLFLAGCVLSMATGSGIGSIVAVMPLAVEIAETTGGNMALLSAIVVSSAMFGDNLSFISDTTVIATMTQGCELKDKFRTNLRIVTIPVLIVLAIYLYLGRTIGDFPLPENVEVWKILPYATLLGMAICGVDVLLSLATGILLCAVESCILGTFDYYQFLKSIGDGIETMGSILILILMASGIAALIRKNGGIDFLVRICSRFVKGRKSAEGCIAILTALLTICTSINTVAILSVADTVKEISQKYGVDPRKAASLMDTSSCVVLELIPYSAHILAAVAFTGISITTILPYMYYPMLLGVAVVISIFVKGGFAKQPAGLK